MIYTVFYLTSQLTLDSLKFLSHSQLWHTRLALLVRCRLLSLADAELAPFADIDRADLFVQFYTLSAASLLNACALS